MNVLTIKRQLSIPPSTPQVSESTSEYELVELAKKGHVTAWDLLLQQNETRLRCALHRIVSCPHSADDIVQETLIRALNKLKTFRGESGFYTWVFRIALNLRSTYMRRPNRKLASLDEQFSIAPVKSDPANGLLRCEQHDDIQNAMQQLGTIHREVLHLKFYEDLDYKAIAQLLCIEVGTVKSRISRAKEALREQLSDRHQPTQ